LRIEQKGYNILPAMTSDADRSEARARLAALLTAPPEPFENKTVAANRRAWQRAGEQERRKMLKDCGWL